MTGRSLGCQRPGVRAVVGAQCSLHRGPAQPGCPPHPRAVHQVSDVGSLQHAARGLGPGWVEPHRGLGLMGSKASWPLQVAGRRPSCPAFPLCSPPAPGVGIRLLQGSSPGLAGAPSPRRLAACRAATPDGGREWEAFLAHVFVFVDDVVFCSLKMYIFSYCT